MKILIPAFLLLTLHLLASCGAPSVGDQLVAQGEGPASALGNEWKRADQMIKSGRDTVEDGNEMIADGKKKIKIGEATINKGERLKAETELAATRAGYLKAGQ